MFDTYRDIYKPASREHRLVLLWYNMRLKEILFLYRSAAGGRSQGRSAEQKFLLWNGLKEKTIKRVKFIKLEITVTKKESR